jgi:glycosyltransferase involved in cell wall biosynthesis
MPLTSLPPLRVLLVDPSLFTAPYDAALTAGLVDAGVAPMWATRPVRAGDRQELPAQYVDDFFYRRTDSAEASGWRAVVKGAAHLQGLAALIGRVFRHRSDVVHVQWLVLPLFDALAIAAIRLFKPVVLTVHDTVPFNGERMSLVKRMGFRLPLRLAHRLITHTQAGRNHLIAAGVPAGKIRVIPHGPLKIAHPIAARPAVADAPVAAYNVVLFGEIKPYKGLDVLVEAVGMLPAAVQDRLRVFVAGRPRMELADLHRRIAVLGVEQCFSFEPRRITEEEMAQLFSAADCFVFPYRQIDASGVYFLVKALGRWLIASKVGVFAEQMDGVDDGRLVDSGDVQQLASALQEAVQDRPQPRAMPSKDSWESIGRQTRQIYEELLARQPAVQVTR